MENYEEIEMQQSQSEKIESSEEGVLSKKRNFSEINSSKESLLDGLDCSEMSKHAKRRLIKKLQWEKWKPQKRAKEKEKLKQKRAQARINNISLGPSRKALKNSTMAASNCKIRLTIDFSFDHLMNNRDLGKCLKQLNHCYSLNRRAANPMQFYVTNFSGESEKEMSKNVGYKNWDVHFLTQSYLEVFDKNELVYLTSDSNNVISTLDESKVYIIGGLVDHNTHKGLCYQIAKDQGIAHAQLPIGEFIEMKSRRVLTIDHGSLDFDGVSRWDDIRATYDLDKSSAEFCMLHKLKDSHLASIGTQKMKVAKAAQVLSHSVAATIMYAVRLGSLPSSALATSTFVKLEFNICNARS